MAGEQVEEHLAEYVSGLIVPPDGSTVGDLDAAIAAWIETLEVQLPALDPDDPEYFGKGMAVTFEAHHILWNEGVGDLGCGVQDCPALVLVEPAKSDTGGEVVFAQRRRWRRPAPRVQKLELLGSGQFFHPGQAGAGVLERSFGSVAQFVDGAALGVPGRGGSRACPADRQRGPREDCVATSRVWSDTYQCPAGSL